MKLSNKSKYPRPYRDVSSIHPANNVRYSPKNLCKPRYKVYLCSTQSSTEACGYKNKDFGYTTEIYGYTNEDCGSRKKP